MKQELTIDISTSPCPADGRPVEIVSIDRSVYGATWHISPDDLRAIGINPEVTERLWISAEDDGLKIVAESSTNPDFTADADGQAESLSAD